MGHEHTATARPFGRGARWWTSPGLRLWGALTVLALAWDASGLDRWVMDRWADATGFGWRHHPWLAHWGHDAARTVVAWLFAGLWGYTVFALVRHGWRDARSRRWLEAALGVTLCLLLIAALKRSSLTSCPWDLARYGGTAQWVSHWAWGVPDGGPGRCFPGGHASAAFGWWPLALAWAPRRRPGAAAWPVAWHLWIGIGLVGLAFGAVQTVRGAHYPSHTFWTAWLCWTAALLHHAAWQWWGHRATTDPAVQATQTSTSTASP